MEKSAWFWLRLRWGYFVCQNLECSSLSKKKPRFWNNQERNDSAPHRIALGFNMLYAIPPALGKITIKSLFFWRTARGYLTSTQSLLYGTDVHRAWCGLLWWSIFMKSGQVIQMQWQWQDWQGQTGSWSVWVLCPGLLSCLQGSCWQEASPNTQLQGCKFQRGYSIFM